MWCPGISAIVTQLFFCRSLHGMGWGWGKTRYQVASWLIPLAYTAVAYAVLWGTGLAPLSDTQIATEFEKAGAQGAEPRATAGDLPRHRAPAGQIANCAAALGEEIGWRGFLVPQLVKVRGYSQTAWISGLIWSAWHYPLLIFGGYTNEGVPTWYALMALYGHGAGAQFCVRLATAQIRQPVDGNVLSREPQSVRASGLHAIDGPVRDQHVPRRRIRGRPAIAAWLTAFCSGAAGAAPRFADMAKASRAPPNMYIRGGGLYGREEDRRVGRLRAAAAFLPSASSNSDSTACSTKSGSKSPL